jgi:hypothetical protein
LRVERAEKYADNPACAAQLCRALSNRPPGQGVRGHKARFAKLLALTFARGARMRYVWLGNSLQEWGAALALALGASLLMYAGKCFILRRLDAIAQRTATRVDDWFARILRSTYPVFMIVVSFYLGSLLLDLPR